jgi:hypothetical protein
MVRECFAKTHADGTVLGPAPMKKAKHYGYQIQKSMNETEEEGGTNNNSGVYVLSNETGTKMYVGKSNNIHTRVQTHLNGEGTVFFASMGEQIEQVEILPCHNGDLESLERNKTLELMYKHGIENVRGWMFTTTHLNEGATEDAFKQICEKYDLCRKCGRNTHFVDKCFARTRAAWAPMTKL